MTQCFAIVLVFASGFYTELVKAARVYPGQGEDMRSIAGSVVELDGNDTFFKKGLWEEFFADPLSWTKPARVPSDRATQCRTWCSTFATELGKYTVRLGPEDGHVLGVMHKSPVMTYGFNDNSNIIFQWSGRKVGSLDEYGALFGGKAEKQVFINGHHSMGPDVPKGVYATRPHSGMGETSMEVYHTLCRDGQSDNAQRKYAIPMHWDTVREMRQVGFSEEWLLTQYYRQVDFNSNRVDFLPQDAVFTTRRERGKEGKEELINSRTGKLLDPAWLKIDQENVGTIKHILDIQNRGAHTSERRSLDKFKKYQRALLVIKYSCMREPENARAELEMLREGRGFQPSYVFTDVAIYVSSGDQAGTLD